MKPIDKAEHEKRLKRISNIFADMARHADIQAKHRCPYKNRLDQCTAQFGCQNKRIPKAPGELPACASNDQLDYRNAWETNPEEVQRMRSKLRGESSMNEHTNHPQTARVSCQNDDCPATKGNTIFDHADELKVKVPTSCGRNGTCHECIVEIKHGIEALSPPTDAESFLSNNYRLACQAVVEQSDQNLDFALLRRAPRILPPRSHRKMDIDPMVTRHGDGVYYDGEQIDTYRGHLYGISIDVGTTTAVAELVDLETGEPVYTTSFENSQRFGGSDIMNRISYDGGPYRGELHKAIINTLNGEIRSMRRRLRISMHEIYEIVIVGNSTMRDLFFNLDVQEIGQKPYKSSIERKFLEGQRNTTALTVLAPQLEILANHNARIYGVPLIASHVGADAAANLVAIDMANEIQTVMVVDVGTNTEVVIGHKDKLIASSCPAGPAFEGGLVKFGMPGCDGAIESLRYKNGRFEYKTIGDVDPVGICGSGLIDLLAELVRHDLMNPLGVFADDLDELMIVPEHGITFSRSDASELAQAKAANYCGQIILMRKYGIHPEQIDKLYLAGGFANYVDSSAAVDIGFIAPAPIDQIVKIGNSAAEGARELLLSRKKRENLERLIKTIEHVELETTPDFFEMFVEGCQFKPMRIPEAPV